MKTYTFEATILKHPDMNAAFVEFPYDVEEEFGTRGQVKVHVWFDDVEYRGSLAKMKHHCHFIGLNQKVRKELGKDAGDAVRIRLQKDNKPRVITIPEDLDVILKSESGLKEYFDSLSYTHQKEYVEWIESAKKPETRDRRMIKCKEMLRDKIKHP
ncbi:DUF1905 domain-containing protein [Balneola sp. MJW-20]|uniref:DUF1905 domain-containing protein n=1 Tax=Gracilimonas aurantiaca TaxID=3234185 RepID=UPI00346704FD